MHVCTAMYESHVCMVNADSFLPIHYCTVLLCTMSIITKKRINQATKPPGRQANCKTNKVRCLIVDDWHACIYEICMINLWAAGTTKTLSYPSICLVFEDQAGMKTSHVEGLRPACTTFWVTTSIDDQQPLSSSNVSYLHTCWLMVWCNQQHDGRTWWCIQYPCQLCHIISVQN